MAAAQSRVTYSVDPSLFTTVTLLPLGISVTFLPSSNCCKRFFSSRRFKTREVCSSFAAYMDSPSYSSNRILSLAYTFSSASTVSFLYVSQLHLKKLEANWEVPTSCLGSR